MHTEIQESHLCLVIETYLEIVDLNQKNKTHYVSLGFGNFKLFGEKGVAVPTSIPMFKGTPRYLICKAPLKEMTTHTCSLNVQIKEYGILNPMKILIPSQTLWGMNDVIPGLVGGKISLKRDANVLCGNEDLVLSQIAIETSRGFEKKFNIFLEDLVFEKYKLKDEIQPKATLLRVGHPRIIERKMYIDYDNSWRLSDEKAFVALEAPRNDTYNAIGHLEVKDFIIDPNVALVFKIEFQTEMPTSDRKKKEKASFTIAWGYFLPDYNSDGEILAGSIDSELKLGPGMTPDGSILWSPYQSEKEKISLEVCGELCTKGKFDPQAISKRVHERTPKVNVDEMSLHDDKLFSPEESLRGSEAIPTNNAANRDLKQKLEREKRDKDKFRKEIEDLKQQK